MANIFYRAESNNFRPDLPGGTASAFRIVSESLLKTKSLLKIIIYSRKRKNYDLEFDAVKTKWWRMTHFYYEESIKIAQKNQRYKNQSDTNQHNKESLSMDLIVYLY